MVNAVEHRIGAQNMAAEAPGARNGEHDAIAVSERTTGFEVEAHPWEGVHLAIAATLQDLGALHVRPQAQQQARFHIAGVVHLIGVEHRLVVQQRRKARPHSTTEQTTSSTTRAHTAEQRLAMGLH